jgi:signal transduction histidine kinase
VQVEPVSAKDSPSAGSEFFAGLDPVRLQQRLQDAGTISGRIAHAFDNVLTGIMGFAELTLSQTDARSPNRPFLEEVVKAAQQGVQLTQQLHFFGRCAVPTRGPAILSYVLGEEEARLRSSLAPGVSLQIDVPADLPAVAIDAELFRQVIAHLLDNAHEAVGSKGNMTLTARRTEADRSLAADTLGSLSPGPCVEVTVANNGPEISPDIRRRILQEPFFSTKPRHRGLGLAIVYRILHAHHGGFRMSSTPAQTAVHLYLPLPPTEGNR